MLPEPTEAHSSSGHNSDATRRQRFGLILAIGLSVMAGGISYLGTRDSWVTPDPRPDVKAAASSSVTMDPAWDLDLPDEPHRDVFQTSCLICHSARLPLSQPPFDRQHWVEIVHKMVAVYGAPMTPDDESHVVDYLLAARPIGL